MSSYLERQGLWRLTVAYWPDAAEAGVHPVIGRFGDLIDQKCPPNLYHPSEIDFRTPPTRADFLQVVRQVIWMHVWEQELLPIIAANHWPMMQFGHDGSSVDLMAPHREKQGKELLCVGRLSVNLYHFYLNNSPRSEMLYDEGQAVIKRFRKEKRHAADALLMQHENWILEQARLQGDTPEVRTKLIKELFRSKL